MKNSHCGKNKLLISKIINNYLTGEVPCSVSMVMQSSLKKSRKGSLCPVTFILSLQALTALTLKI
jgi:hypothetical protein